jgi:hypothetical protein
MVLQRYGIQLNSGGIALLAQDFNRYSMKIKHRHIRKILQKNKGTTTKVRTSGVPIIATCLRVLDALLLLPAYANVTVSSFSMTFHMTTAGMFNTPHVEVFMLSETSSYSRTAYLKWTDMSLLGSTGSSHSYFDSQFGEIQLSAMRSFVSYAYTNGATEIRWPINSFSFSPEFFGAGTSFEACTVVSGPYEATNPILPDENVPTQCLLLDASNQLWVINLTNFTAATHIVRKSGGGTVSVLLPK